MVGVADSKLPTQSVVLGGTNFNVILMHPERAEFWRSAELGHWEDATIRFLQKALNKQTTFVDIGAWIGPVSLVASAYAKRVLALEPDPVAAAELEANVQLNRAAIEVWRTGIDEASGEIKLFAKTGFGDTMTSSLGDPDADWVTVRSVSFQDIRAAITGASHVVIKMDVEGHEFRIVEPLVEFLKQHDAAIHLSIHSRLYYDSARRNAGPIRARVETYLVMRRLIDALQSVGIVRVAKTGNVVTRNLLRSFAFLRRKPKNFAVEMFPDNAQG